MIYRAPDQFYRSTLLDQFTWLDHAFGTRHHNDWTANQPTAKLKQIHSTVVRRVENETGFLGEGDALYTAHPGIWIGIRTADCVPLILADPDHHAVAVIHAGWRGTVDGILAATLNKMRADFATAPSRTVLAIGPAIAYCCFEVGPEVAERFQPWFPERSDLHQKTTLDLHETLTRQAHQLGIPAHQISKSPDCTRCSDPATFHSYRRDRDQSGRMVTAARVKA